MGPNRVSIGDSLSRALGRRLMTAAAEASINMAPASKMRLIGGCSFPWSMVSRAIAVIAMKIGSVMGILLLS